MSTVIEQDEDVERGRKAMYPSSGAGHSNFKSQQYKYPVLNGRPSTLYGPPIGLFHPVFDMMCSTIQNTDMRLPPQQYEDTKEFLKVSSEIYGTGRSRLSEIKPALRRLLDGTFARVRSDDMESDGVIMHPSCGENAYIVILEAKNEIGAGGSDPYNQVSLAFRKYWADVDGMYL